MKNVFELRNGEKHVKGFVSKDGTKLVSHLLTPILKTSQLVRPVKGFIA